LVREIVVTINSMRNLKYDVIIDFCLFRITLVREIVVFDIPMAPIIDVHPWSRVRRIPDILEDTVVFNVFL